MIEFSKPGAKHLVSTFPPQRLGHFAPLSFTTDGRKFHATRCAGER